MNIRSYKNSDSDLIKLLIIDNLKYHEKIDTLGIRKYLEGEENEDFEKFTKTIANGDGIGLVAEENDQVIGFGFAYFMYDEVHQKYKGQISKVFVSEGYRGKGYGTSLVKALEKYLMDKACKTITLNVYSPNTGAHNLYLKNGYKDRFIEMIKIID